jgi:hypothetical protein
LLIFKDTLVDISKMIIAIEFHDKFAVAVAAAIIAASTGEHI